MNWAIDGVKAAAVSKGRKKKNADTALETPTAPPASVIQVRGARVHNLKNVDVDLPRDRLVVLTGVSGSGKSSLAFDTIHAEGQRRYLECLSGYARQILERLERPDVDAIEGLPPTVAIDQRAGTANPRSTLGTITEIHDYLRLLFARAGIPHCPQCGEAIRRQSPEQIVNRVLFGHDGEKVQILAPLVRAKKGKHVETFEAIRRAGLIRARIDGAITEVSDKPPALPAARAHTIEAVVDRIAVRDGIRPRLTESLEMALKLSGGTVLVLTESKPAGTWEEQLYSIHLSCPACGTSLPEFEPRSFSFNHAFGMCPNCHGLGTLPFPPNTAEPETERTVCPDCGGSRLRPEARSVQFAGRAIHELTDLQLTSALVFFESIPADAGLLEVVTPLAAEIASRLRYLLDVGLGYLSLSRGADTLSGGELQRARLAAQLGSGLVGVCAVLDEPTAGLHPRDTSRLIGSVRRLVAQGNTALVVEHDAFVIESADWVLDLGPGAGPDGGLVLACCPPDRLAEFRESVTARFLNRPVAIRESAGARLAAATRWIEIQSARVNNLKDVDARIPVGSLTCVTGVSGSGKSTLVHDLLARHARQLLRERPRDRHALATDLITGLDAIDQLIEINQTPLGRGPRSTPATATGAFDQIRRLFATTREARLRGYRASRFSFNAKGGQCETCRGLGIERLPTQFLSDLDVPCPDCDGKRFNRQTLEIRYKEKSIGDVLNLRIDESLAFFAAIPAVVRPLETLHEVGLGYLTLGQSSTKLSGGETQRIKLAAELGRVAFGRALYLLDEPTTGLHFADIERLLKILHRLADLGHTVVVIEHHLDLIAEADWVIDMGPEGGDGGGRVIAMGPPASIRSSEASWTGRALRDARSRVVHSV